MQEAGITPEPAFFDSKSRQLNFATNHDSVRVIRVRSFDVATFVAFGAAHLGIAGNDVLMEFEYSEIYSPLDLGIGKCRLAVAEPRELSVEDDPRKWSHVRVATKYPNITRASISRRAACRPNASSSTARWSWRRRSGLCSRIVDLVSTGSTLKANGLVEVEQIAEISSRLIVNRATYKTRPDEVIGWIDRFREVLDAA